MSMLNNIKSMHYFHDGPRNIERELYMRQLLQIQMMTMSFRKTMKTVMTVIMKKSKEVNWFNKLKISFSFAIDFQYTVLNISHFLIQF